MNTDIKYTFFYFTIDSEPFIALCSSSAILFGYSALNLPFAKSFDQDNLVRLQLLILVYSLNVATLARAWTQLNVSRFHRLATVATPRFKT